jgi:hybrid cluster-associated redox disulfide protein
MKTKTKTKEQKAISKKAITHRLRDTLNKEITEEMTFAEILEKHPESANILFENGLHCIGCGMAMYETLEQGCLAHGFSKKQIDNLIKKLNQKVK